MRRIEHWIDGRTVVGAARRESPVFDPATGVQTAAVVLAGADDVDRAVAAARDAFASWSGTPLSRRAEIMFRVRELLDARRKELAATITAEHGKTVADALGEVARGLENVEFACGVPHLLKGGHSAQASNDVDVWSLQQPLGVMVGITPFNFPAMVPMWMFATAIACGNTFVLKPSERDPSASLFLAEVLHEAGVPAGVFNVVHGDSTAVDALLAHPDVAAVSFVGSTPVARHVYETASAHAKRVQALGGAKNHMVVLADADVDAAADAAVSAAYGSAGERCMAISVVVAVDAIADRLVGAIAARARTVRVGAGTDADTEMGPLITAAHRDRVVSYVASAAEQGATIVVDGRELPARDGFFVGPTLVDHVQPAMDVYRDEVFGPVLCVVRVASLADAIALVNANPYGNGTAIFTRDGASARRFEHAVEVGMVGVNVPVPVPVSYYSFGGWKASLFGDAHMYGPDGIRFCTRTKVVTARWSEPATTTVDLTFPGTR